MLSEFETLIIQDIRAYSVKPISNYPFQSRLVLIRLLLFNKGFRAIYLYRKTNNHYRKQNRIRCVFFIIIQNLFIQIEISHKATIGGGLRIAHPQAIVIGATTIIGENAFIGQCVTIGANRGKRIKEQSHPIIGNNFYAYAGSKIIGPILIGDNVTVGVNSVVLNDVGSNAVVVGVPARDISLT